MHFAVVFIDITERKEAERKDRRENREISLAGRMFRVFLEESDDVLYDRALEIVMDGLESRHGVFGYIDEAGTLVCPTMSRMFDHCEMPDKCICYAREKWKGLWSRALLEKRVLFTNESPPVPRGHVAIENNMAAPILFHGEVIGLLNLANKSGDYTEEDRELLEGLTVRIAPALYIWIQKKRHEGERSRAEQFLRQSREDLNRAQVVGNIGSWRLDVRKNELTWSDENHRIFGIPEGTPMTYETFLSTVHPADREYVDSRWGAGLAGEPYDIEHRIVVGGESSGEQGRTIKWVREKAYLEFDEAGALLGGFGITQDITQRKNMEEEIRKSRDELEMRVKQRTAELNRTVADLQREAKRRIAAEQRIRAERQQFNDVLETLPSYVCLLAPDYRVPFANKVFRENFGYDPERKCYEFLFGRTEPCEDCQTFTVMRTNKSHRWEWTGPNGRDYDIFDFPFEDTDGSQLILEMGIDVTERKRAERRLRTTNALLALLARKACRQEYLDSVVRIIHRWSGCRCVGVRLTDSDGYIPYQAYTGFSEEFLSLESNLCLNRDICACIRVISGGAESQDSDVMTRRGSFCCNDAFAFVGSLSEKEKMRFRGNCPKAGFASVGVVPIRYRQDILGAIHIADEARDKVPVEVVEYLEDIAALVGEAVHRFDVEEALRLNEGRLLEAQRLAHLGNWEWDIARNKLWWSDEVYRIFGVEPGEFAATNEAFLSYVHPDDRELVEEAVNRALDGNEAYGIDHRVSRPDGSIRIVHEQAETLRDAEGKAVRMRGTVQDISVHKEAEERILADQAALKALTSELQLIEEKERRKIAGDLHDSIGQILAFSRRELAGIEKSAPEEIAVSLKEVGGQLKQAVKQARTLSFELSPSILYDLGLEAALEDLAERFSEERKTKCRFESLGEIGPLEESVKVLIYRSVRELLINTVKHAEASEVRISALSVDNQIRVEVKDNGKGFDVSDVDSEPGRPKGFGLFSIRERFSHIGGRFEVETGKGKGTRITLAAPIAVKASESKG